MKLLTCDLGLKTYDLELTATGWHEVLYFV
jgi:hypothetical protein